METPTAIVIITIVKITVQVKDVCTDIDVARHLASGENSTACRTEGVLRSRSQDYMPLKARIKKAII